jgi:hypothetical protein
MCLRMLYVGAIGRPRSRQRVKSCIRLSQLPEAEIGSRSREFKWRAQNYFRQKVSVRMFYKEHMLKEMMSWPANAGHPGETR